MEEIDSMLNKVVSEGVWTNEVEAHSWSTDGRGKWENRGEEGRREVVRDEMISRVKDSKAKVIGLKISRQFKTEEFRNQVSQNIFKQKTRKILENCKREREAKRDQYDNKLKWLKHKYWRVKDE